MNTRWSGWGWKLGLVSWLAIGGAIPFGIASLTACLEDGALAQIVPDATLGAESSVVAPNAGGVDEISGGATRGGNLFHSFEQFSVLTGREAFFDNAGEIQNIISRVTGSSISNIDGKIRANGTANLFLINPNGISFGPNATLSIGGSFLGSTASAIKFADGNQFSATAQRTTPLLTISVPLGLQVGDNAGSIRVQGAGQSQAFLNNGIVNFDRSVGLSVMPGQTLALVGGNVQLDGGILQTAGGRVELGGLNTAGTVGLNGDGSLSFPEQVQRADVSLTNGAGVNVAAGGGGSIVVNARNLDALSGSILSAGIASDLGAVGSQAGDITLNVTGEITANGSDFYNLVQKGAVGKAGDINITTDSLAFTKGATLNANTIGQGDGGNVNIIARNTVSFDGERSERTPSTAPILSSGIFSIVEREAEGKGGNVKVTTGSLSLTNGAQLNASTDGRGDAGNMQIIARDTVSFDGELSNRNVSGVFSSVNETAEGNGGNVNISTGSLFLTRGGIVQVSTYGKGDAGSIHIRARDTVSFDGEGTGKAEYPTPSGVISQVGGTAFGDGGVIDITTGSLSLTNGARVTVNTIGQGNGGNVNIIARDSVSIDGVRKSNGEPGAVLSEVTETGIGRGGNITVTARSIRLDDRGKLSSETKLGQGGNINLEAQDLLLLRHGSQISTTAGTSGTGGNGGNITIKTDNLVGMENSDITANASIGSGGRVNITAFGIFGIQPRPRTTPLSDITATSEAGTRLNGTVEINTPDIDPSGGLVELLVQPVAAEVVQVCQPRTNQAQNEFVVTGRGGLPPSPGEALSSDAIQVDWVTLNPGAENRSSPTVSTNPTSQTPAPIVEAQGWVINNKGEVVLTANPPAATHNIPWLPESNCHALKSSSSSP